MLRSLWQVTKESWARIEPSGRRTLYLYTFSMIVISALDGWGLVLLNKLTGKSTTGGSGSLLAGHTTLGLTVIGMFVMRSVLAAGITWLGYYVFAKEEVRVGAENFREYSRMDWGRRANEQVADIYSFVDRGPFAMVQQLLLPIGTTVAEIANALVLFVVLMVLDPITAGTTVVFFLLVALIQHRVLSVTMSKAGQDVANELNLTYNILSDAFDLGKVVRVMPSHSLDSALSNSRNRLAQARAKTIFLESLPRYLMESMLAVGVVVVGGVTVITRGSDALLPSLSVFGVAGFRLLPIVNRIQGLILSFLGREPLARLALREIPQIPETTSTSVIAATSTDVAVLQISSVSYRYPGAAETTLLNVTLEFERGKRYALVGPSGSGKSTLVDLCLGLLAPDSGTISWKLNSDDVVGYVPQDSALAGTSLSNNVALEWDPAHVDREQVLSALQAAALSGLDHERSIERLTGLSGGQRQRVGLARAIYRGSTVLFLDEPTSALDAETEHEVMESIRALGADVTTIIVAHRISTIQDVDCVIYLENGQVLGQGPFNDLRRALPQFARQIELGAITLD